MMPFNSGNRDASLSTQFDFLKLRIKPGGKNLNLALNKLGRQFTRGNELTFLNDRCQFVVAGSINIPICKTNVSDTIPLRILAPMLLLSLIGMGAILYAGVVSMRSS